MFAEYIYDQKNFLVKVWFPLAITSYSKCYFKIRFLDNNEWLTKMVSTGYNKLQ